MDTTLIDALTEDEAGIRDREGKGENITDIAQIIRERKQEGQGIELWLS